MGFTRSLTEEGSTARRVQAVLEHNTNERISMTTKINSSGSAFSCPADRAKSLALWETLKYWPPVQVSRPEFNPSIVTCRGGRPAEGGEYVSE